MSRFFWGLCAVTIALAATMVFTVQPMVGKLLTPHFGGSASVWLVVMLFCQTALLCGYWAADLLRRIPNLQLQRFVYVCLLAVSLWLSFGDLRVNDETLGNLIFESVPAQVGAIFWMLAKTIGLPFTVLTMASPMVQYWYAHSSLRERDPYILYAASNFGSLIGLVGYPFVLERTLPLQQQYQGWIVGAAAVAVGLVAMTAIHWGRESEGVRVPQTERVPLLHMLRWLVLAFVPSSLMLGVTTYIATDIASIPLVWIGPLSLYLVSMMLGFSGMRVRRSFLVAASVAAFVLLLSLQQPNRHWLIWLHMLGFAIIATVFHALLYATRPTPSRLTQYYGVVALGGVLGGVFNAVLSPLLFDSTAEYPLALVAALVLVWALDPNLRLDRSKRFRMGRPIVRVCICVVIVGLVAGFPVDPRVLYGAASLCILSALLLTKFQLAAAVVGLAAAGIALIGPGSMRPRDSVVARSFYGTYRVHEEGSGVRYLSHGTTVHGSQVLDDPERPTGYYGSEGPLGDVFDWASEVGEADVVVAGLGAGTIAGYAKRVGSILFLELDPLVTRIAREYFTYLSTCGDRCAVEHGDARVLLRKKRNVDVLVLDTFSSDSIPVHLVTREAFAAYFRALSQDGVVAFHVSSRSLDLAPVIAEIARSLGVKARRKSVRLADAKRRGDFGSDWIVLSKASKPVQYFEARGWEPIEAAAGAPWTDQFADVISAYRDLRP